jgi:hypothetical protein
MRNNIYATYTSEKNVELTTQDFSNLLNIEFTPRSSDYIGNYSLYTGALADRISIEPIPEDISNCNVNIQITEGKNKDKDIKWENIHNVISNIKTIKLLKKTITTEP